MSIRGWDSGWGAAWKLHNTIVRHFALAIWCAASRAAMHWQQALAPAEDPMLSGYIRFAEEGV